MDITIHTDTGTLVCTSYSYQPPVPPVIHPVDKSHPGAPEEFEAYAGYEERDGVHRELTKAELEHYEEEFRLEYLEQEQN